MFLRTTVLVSLFVSFILAFGGGYVNNFGKRNINSLLNYAYEIPYATRIIFQTMLPCTELICSHTMRV